MPPIVATVTCVNSARYDISLMGRYVLQTDEILGTFPASILAHPAAGLEITNR